MATVRESGTNFWLHRVIETVQVNGKDSPPGAGGRCNDWTYYHNHTADGEFAEIISGSVVYHFDQDTIFTGEQADGHAGAGPFDGGPCAGPQRAIPCCNLP